MRNSRRLSLVASAERHYEKLLSFLQKDDVLCYKEVRVAQRVNLMI